MKSRLLKILSGIVFIGLFFVGQVAAKTVTLSWDASPSTVTGYKVYYNAGSSQAPLLGTGAAEGASPLDAGSSLTFTVSGLPDDQVHYFAVVAYDSAGNESVYSNIVESPVSVTPPVVTPPGDKDVTLSWDASPSTVSGYKVYYASGSSLAPLLGTGAVEGDSPIDVGNVLTFSVTGLAEDQIHYFAVAAYDANGNESPYSNIVESPVVGTENNVPVLSAIGSKSVLEGASTNFTISASDADGDSLTYSATSLPSGAGFNTSTQTFSWSPGFDQAGSYDVIFTVSDGTATDSETVVITVVNVNRTPSLGTIGAKTVGETEALSFSVTGSDPDSDSLTYSATNLPAGASFNGSTRTFNWTPNATQGGSYSVTFAVTDGSASDSEAVAITVVEGNQSPVLAAIGSKQGAENSSLSFTVSATDADTDPLTYNATNLPEGAIFNSSTGVFNWTPDYAQAGVYSVTFSVSDGSLSDSEVVSLTINDVNRAPLLAEIGTQTVGEGTVLSFTISGFDPDDDGLTYSATDLPSGANFNEVTRQFSWTPSFELTENTRIYPVTFAVTDGALSDSETVTINVTNVNRAPVLDAIGNQNLTEGDSLNLVVSASDPDNNSLVYSASNIPAGAVFTPSTRSLSWIPANDQSGTYTVTFTVSDGSLSDSEAVILTVANLNQAPMLDSIGNQSVNEGVELVMTITASDAENDSLIYSASGLPEGATFDAVLRRFNWTPNYAQAGSFTIVFSVTDGVLSDSETVTITVVNSNQSPLISGSPATTVMAKGSYSFTPVASDPDGDELIFSISNKPVWANFDTASGQLSGTPTELQTGTTSAIAIGASDGNSIVFLPLFSIEVLAYAPVDSDGDGVLDHLDAFPADGNEWLDTDGDLIGNNADTDDDNDGVADVRDGSPLDSTKSGWVITASAGSGGFITPEGETSVLYGGSQNYTLTPMTGYYIDDLLVDNVSVGTVASYQFDNVTTHHSVEAVFVPIPTGLSVDPITVGLAGVERVDGGDDSSNLVSGNPKLNLEYRFQVTLRDSVAADQRDVYLVLDGYRFQMKLDSGAISNGAQYTYDTKLGPAYAHQFHFIVIDNSGNPLGRYPTAGELNGPTVELLNGKNLIGISADIDSATLGSLALLGDNRVYRWVTGERSGEFALVNNGGPMITGEGYLFKRTINSTLPTLDMYGEVSSASHEIPVAPGWNLIANPYKGSVALADVRVVNGAAAAIDWSTAVADNLVIDAVYSYLGEDWGDRNDFASAAGAESALLTPWIGYWIYVNPTDQPVKLLITRPQQ